MNEIIKNNLILAGIRNLKDFGYEDVNEDNILTDKIYKSFFKNMLEENKGRGKDVDLEIDELIKIISE